MAAASVAAVVLPLGAAAQGLAPLPVAPPPVSVCVRRYGHTGCAAKLYAELLCQIVGQPSDLYREQRLLQQRYSEEQLDFSGMTAAQVETAAVRYYVPQLCPQKKEQVWGVLGPREAG
jgi:hypothetical protein